VTTTGAGTHITTGNRLDVMVEGGKVVGLWHWPDDGERLFIRLDNPWGLLGVLQSTMVEHARVEPHDFQKFHRAYNVCELCWLPEEAHADS
jgi:hypothetical protein